MPHRYLVLTVPLVLVWAFAAAPVLADPVLAPGDFIIAIDTDPPESATSSSPAAEEVENILDQDSSTKYLNFGQAWSGFIVTPDPLFIPGLAPLQSFQLTTANDHDERDPASWELYGTDDAICSLDHSGGECENWTLIGSGDLSLPTDRFTLGGAVNVTNSTIYQSYKMLFPTVRNSATANSMQVADVQFYEAPDALSGTEMLFGFAGEPTLAINVSPNPIPDSSYPGNEAPPNAIDTTLAKYLNFGEENSGFIVTPASGSSVIDSFQITTANDAVERDPTTWELYGTDDSVTSEDNSQGSDENWTLIDSGDIVLPPERDTEGPVVTVDNQGSTAYSSYRMIFPTVLDEAAANSMQIAEIQFFGTVVTQPDSADFNGDGNIDGNDFAAWQRGFGIIGTAALADGDANGDTNVDALDFDVWKIQFGTTAASSASAAVPEPSTMAIVFAGLVAAILFRSRRLESVC